MKTFFFGFILILLFTFTEAAARSKRKFDDISSSPNENVLEESNVIKMPRTHVSARPAPDPNYTAKIFELPPEILAHIASYLKNPYIILPKVSFDFFIALKTTYPPHHLLIERSPSKRPPVLPPSPELARLLSISPKYFKHSFKKLLHPDSIFHPKSPEMVTRFVQNVLKMNPYDPYERNRVFFSLLKDLNRDKLYKSILTISVLVPDLIIDDVDDEFYENMIKLAISLQDGSIVVRLLKQLRKPFRFLAILTAYPVSVEFFDFSLGQMIHFGAEKVVSFILQSLTFFTSSTINRDCLDMIRNRNHLLIDRFQSSLSTNLVACVRFCIDLRYRENVEELSTSEISNILQGEFADILNKAVLERKIWLEYHCTLLHVALIRNCEDIFKKILKLSRSTAHLTTEFKDSLKKSPAILASLSKTRFVSIFGVKDSLFLYQQNRLSPQELEQMRNVHEKLRILSQIMAPDQFMSYLRAERATKFFSVSTLIKNMIKTLDNPARIVHLVLCAFENIPLQEQELQDLKFVLRKSKYLNSLLSPENKDILDSPFAPMEVSISTSNFECIMSHVEVLKAPEAQCLRNRFRLHWREIFLKHHLYPETIERFFSIWGLKIGNFDAVFHNDDDTKSAINLIDFDSRELFKNPEFLEPYIDCFLASLAVSLFETESSTNKNPLTHKSYGIFSLWMEKNLKSFIRNASPEILKVFQPEINEHFVENIILREPEFDSHLLLKILNHAWKPNFIILKLDISTFADFNRIFYEFQPAMNTEIGIDVQVEKSINWESIILTCSSVLEFEMVLEFMDGQDFRWLIDNLELPYPPKMVSFINHAKLRLLSEY